MNFGVNIKSWKHNILCLLLCFLFVLFFIIENLYTISLAVGSIDSINFFIRSYLKFCFTYLIIAIIILNLHFVLQFTILTVNSIINIFIKTYSSYLGTPSISEILNQIISTDSNFNVLYYNSWTILFSYLLIYFIQVSLLYILYKRCVARCAKKFLCCIFLGTILISVYSFYLSQHNTSLLSLDPAHTISKNIARRGYIPVWILELVSPPQWASELTCNKSRIDRLKIPNQKPDRIIYIQVESLDYKLVGLNDNDLSIMPFLGKIADKSLFFKLDGKHIALSANSDYELLCTRVAQPPFVAYELVNSKAQIDFSDSIPFLLKAENYKSIFLNGVDEEMYRNAFTKMGADQVILKKDLIIAGSKVDTSAEHAHISDNDLFQYAKNFMVEEKLFQVIITMDMHDPIPSLYDKKFDGTAYPEYFATANNTDRVIGEFIDALPEDTLVIIMGDHVPHHGIKSGFVPGIIYQKGRNLSSLSPDKDNVYSRCEFSKYIRKLLSLPDVSPSIPIAGQ